MDRIHRYCVGCRAEDNYAVDFYAEASRTRESRTNSYQRWGPGCSILLKSFPDVCGTAPWPFLYENAAFRSDACNIRVTHSLKVEIVVQLVHCRWSTRRAHLKVQLQPVEFQQAATCAAVSFKAIATTSPAMPAISSASCSSSDPSTHSSVYCSGEAAV